jgi:tetratricopeptide (TPR) repeat protein
MFAGDDEKTQALLEGVHESAFEEQFYFVPAALLEAQVLDRRGRRVPATARFAEARRIAEAQLAKAPDDSRAHSALGLALAGLGDKVAAIKAGEAGVAAMPVEKEAYRGAYRLEDLARICAAVGERDRAVEILTRLMSMPTDLAGPALAIDPAWGPLRGHPGFERVVAGSSRK